ncbi:hypothetical protein [Streptomyces sp. WM6378]|uniref:hypothetical protein n=1 Tax=Streptomyces sp. WM6378 TaxID=1415557 RepID=UPI0006AF8D91|nr:hypothetical protein [Streptomyces sp. WM6378]KOU46855.1 hypothetical protein ADK54_13965 [Streptomyces sp. WM6378]
MQSSTHRRKFSAAIAGVVVAAIVGTGLVGSAEAADRGSDGGARSVAISQMSGEVDASTPAESGLDGVSDAEGIAAVQRALDRIAAIPEALIQRVEAGDPDAVREVSDWLERNPQAAQAIQAFGWFGCAAGVAKFAAENGIGVAKAWRLVKNGKKVAQAIWAYVKHGQYPGRGIDDEIVNLIVNSTGLPDLAHACL